MDTTRKLMDNTPRKLVERGQLPGFTSLCVVLTRKPIPKKVVTREKILYCWQLENESITRHFGRFGPSTDGPAK